MKSARRTRRDTVALAVAFASVGVRERSDELFERAFAMAKTDEYYWLGADALEAFVRYLARTGSLADRVGDVVATAMRQTHDWEKAQQLAAGASAAMSTGQGVDRADVLGRALDCAASGGRTAFFETLESLLCAASARLAWPTSSRSSSRCAKRWTRGGCRTATPKQRVTERLETLWNRVVMARWHLALPRTPHALPRLRPFSDSLQSCRPSSCRCSTRSGFWFDDAPRCAWQSSRSGTSWPSCIEPAAHAFASHRPTDSCGRHSRAPGTAGGRALHVRQPATVVAWHRRGFACSGPGRGDDAPGARPCHETSAP